MKKLLNIIKKYIPLIIVTIVLLIIQANCDLALPDYTSDIVDVGISGKGIKYATYEVIREEQLNHILLFTDSKTDEEILKNYDLITPQKSKEYKDQYPLVEKENLYIVKDKSKEKLEELESLMSEPILFYNMFENVTIKDLQENYNGFDQIPEDTKLIDLLPLMSDRDISKMKEEYKKQTSTFGDSIIKQSAISFIEKEYKIIGINIKSKQIHYIFKVGIKMLALAFLSMAMTILSVLTSSKAATGIAKDLRKNTVNKVMNFSNKEFEEISTASLITRSTNDIQQIQMLIVMLFRVVVYAPIIGFGALAKMQGNSLFWVVALAVICNISVVLILFIATLPKFNKIQKLIDRLNLVSREILSGLPVIRAFANEKYEEKRFDIANIDLTKINKFVNRAMSVMMPVMMFIMNGVSVLIIWVGSYKVDTGVLQVGDLIAGITYAVQIIMSFLMLSMVSIMLPRAIISIRRINEILTKEIVIKDKKVVEHLDKVHGILEFKDVYFRYPDAQEDVLENISFTMTPGTTTAIIGSTGSGKSTLIHLIPRFFDVTAGKILLDGIDIRDLSLEQVRKNIGLVPQKGTLFSGTIADNIKFGNKKLTDDKMIEAAKIAQADEFILKKEKKYDSYISQGGSNVSGGQKQRLSIARAIAIDPKIFIFDDSFSALDYKTDVTLRKELAKITKDKSILIVAQRIATVLHADQIIVLDKGTIVGKGTHEELMKSCEVYKEIALSQLSKEELENE